MDSDFPTPKDEQLERDLLTLWMGRTTTVPETAWNLLKAQGHFQDLREGRITWEELVEFAKPLAFYGDLLEQAEALPKSGDTSGNREGEVQAPQFGVYEEERAKTFAEYLELRVAADPDVLQWRRDYLGSTRPLSPEEAYELARNDRIGAGRSFGTSGMTAASYGSEPQEEREELELFIDESEDTMRLPFYEGSMLEGLHDLSKKLNEELFRPWTIADASWLVLTGKVRKAPACLVGKIDYLSNEHLTRNVVTLHVEPWIAAETVLRTYQYLQALTLGRRPRAVSERNLAMVRFVMKQLRALLTTPTEDDAEPPRVSWRRLMNNWNQENEESWAYEDERRFYRDCHRTLRTIVRPYDTTGPLGPGSYSMPPEVNIPEDDVSQHEDDVSQYEES